MNLSLLLYITLIFKLMIPWLHGVYKLKIPFTFERFTGTEPDNVD